MLERDRFGLLALNPPALHGHECAREFRSKIGLGVHVTARHPEVANAQICVERKKARWTQEEVRLLAELEATATLNGQRNINQYLVPLVPGRSLEAIKKRCQQKEYQDLVRDSLARLIADPNGEGAIGGDPDLDSSSETDIRQFDEDVPLQTEVVRGVEVIETADRDQVGVLPSAVAIEYFDQVTGHGVEILRRAARELVDDGVEPSGSIMLWVQSHLKERNVSKTTMTKSTHDAGRKVAAQGSRKTPNLRVRQRRLKTAEYRRNCTEFRSSPRKLADRILTGVDCEAVRPRFDEFVKCWVPVITGINEKPQ
jgi:hypothetical protein